MHQAGRGGKAQLFPKMGGEINGGERIESQIGHSSFESQRGHGFPEVAFEVPAEPFEHFPFFILDT